MILVDTSVWIDHFRKGNPHLADALLAGEVLAHPFVVGELSCGNMRRRAETLALLSQLPNVVAADHEAASLLVERLRLWGKGLGWVDIHLLASASLAGVPLWTLDRALRDAAKHLGLAARDDLA